MRKQKSATPSDPDIKTPKIRKFATPSSSQTQSLSQPINYTPIINPTIGGSYEQLTHFWNCAKKNKLPLSQDQTQVKFQIDLAEKKNQLTQANTEIEELYINLGMGKKEQEKMAKFIEETCQTRDAIIEDQSFATELSTKIQKHINAIINTHDHCVESTEHLTELYNNVALKQQDVIENLIEQFNDKVSKKKKELKEEFDLKSNELLALETKCKQFGEVVEEKTQFINEIDTKIEEYEVIIDNNKKKQMAETAKMLETIKEEEANLKIDQEANYKLEAEYGESSEEYDVLLSKYKSLQVMDSDYQSQINNLTPSLLVLKEEEVALNDQLDKLKNIHCALQSNRELEAAEYRKKLQDLMLMNTEASDKLSQVVSNREELSKIVSKTVEDTEQLENSLKITNDETTEIRKSLKDVLDNNKESNEKIETQKQELIAVENQLYENRAGFEAHKAKQDEIINRVAKVSAELAMIEQQLFEESEESAELIKKIDEEETESAVEAKEFKGEIKEKDEAIAREHKANEDLQWEIGTKQSEYNKKIQDATHLKRRCQSAGHEKQIKEQNVEIDILNQKLSDEKLKNNLVNEQKNAAEAREKEKYEAQVKKMKSNYEDLKKKLSKMKEENEGWLRKLQETQASIELKDTKQETLSISSIPKPILKSAISKSPLKVQKVQFDLPSSLDYSSINVSQMFEESERRYATSTTGANTTDWGEIRIPITPDEPDTTAPVVNESLASKPRKFFKHPRLQTTKTYRFGKK